ncbi:hypothetical protein TUM12370_18640 [Salmonella enterica subsp. enterica serovar Choleraesuis]|nr:hypothetical protein TUM12370_18640 [Salmonella enterica subsp. enterica serovar Choleraesuis]
MFGKTQDKLNQAAGAVEQAFGESTGNVRQQIQGASRKYASQACDTSRDLANGLCSQVKANPLASAAIAGAVGVVIGYLLSRR